MQNYLKFSGIPDSVTTPELIPDLQQLLKALLPLENPKDFIINRAHRLVKPASLLQILCPEM